MLKEQKANPENTLKNIDWDFFENVIVYNSLCDKVYLGTIIDVIDPEFFKNNDIKKIFKIIVDFFKKYSTVPTPTEIKTHLNTQEEKDSWIKVCQSFKQIDSKINQSKLYENTERFLKEKSVYNCLLKTIDGYSNGKISTSDTFEMFNKACNISLIDNLGHNYFRDIDKHIEDLQRVQNHISTGWKWLDERLSGGFLIDGRALYVFCGITNVGKSIVLGNVATNCLAKNNTVVIISLEMPEEIYTKRIDTQLSKIPYNELSTQTGTLKDFVVNYQKTHNNSNLIIKEFPPTTIRVNTIKTYIEKLILKGIKPDVVIVDYLNLVLPNYKTGENTYERIKAVTEQMRALTYTFKIPFITATQINRDGMKGDGKKPEMDGVSESIGISFTADSQIGIYQKESDKELGFIHFSIMKNRFGPAFGNVCMKLDYKTLSISEIPDNIMADNENMDRVSKDLKL